MHQTGLLKDEPRGAYRAILGCYAYMLVEHLESQFVDGMAWDNYGVLWNMDHIVAIKAAPGADNKPPTREEMKARCHYKNIQPILMCDHKFKTTDELRARRATSPTPVEEKGATVSTPPLVEEKEAIVSTPTPVEEKDTPEVETEARPSIDLVIQVAIVQVAAVLELTISEVEELIEALIKVNDS